MRSAGFVSALLIVAGNLVPLAGVVFFDWKILAVMLAFWLDNVGIGLFTAARILFARLDSATGSGRSTAFTRVYAAWDFSFMYAFACLVHGLLVIGLFGFVAQKLAGGTMPEPEDFALGLLRQPETLIAALAVLVTRGIDFVTSYLLPRAYEQADINTERRAPYRRVSLLHLVILLGGGIALALHAPILSLVTLVILKTAGDLIQARK